MSARPQIRGKLFYFYLQTIRDSIKFYEQFLYFHFLSSDSHIQIVFLTPVFFPIVAASKMLDGRPVCLSRLSNQSPKKIAKASQQHRLRRRDCSDRHRENLPRPQQPLLPTGIT